MLSHVQKIGVRLVPTVVGLNNALGLEPDRSSYNIDGFYHTVTVFLVNVIVIPKKILNPTISVTTNNCTLLFYR